MLMQFLHQHLLCVLFYNSLDAHFYHCSYVTLRACRDGHRSFGGEFAVENVVDDLGELRSEAVKLRTLLRRDPSSLCEYKGIPRAVNPMAVDAVDATWGVTEGDF